MGGIGIAIDLVALKNILPGGVALAYYRAFTECLVRAADVAENFGEIAKLTFDISTENEYNAGLLYSVARGTEGQLAKWLDAEISFVPWKSSPRVQTADLLAYEAWKALDRELTEKKPRKSWEVLRATDRFETFAYSEDFFRDVKAHRDSGEGEKIAGFKETDYLDWLRKTGRHHDISNLIRFLGTRK